MLTTPRNRKPFVLMAGFLLLAGAGSALSQTTAQETAQPQDKPEETTKAAAAEPENKYFTLRMDPLVLGVLRSHVDTRSSK
jgi:hypothetical protein